MIIDEADYVLIDRMYRILPVTAKSADWKQIPVIGLTATSYSELTPDESVWLSTDLGYTIYDSKIREELDSNFARTLSITLQDFFGAQFDQYARLLYVEVDRLEKILELAARQVVT